MASCLDGWWTDRFRIVCAVLILSLIGYGAHAEVIMNNRQPIAWSSLAQKHILFAHQSVGENILEGVRMLEQKDGAELSIVEARKVGAPGITHFFVGNNGDPLGKIKDFSNAMTAAGEVDVAVLKLCFWDFNPDNRHVDARQVAMAYSDTLQQLEIRYPHTFFIAMTVPLMAPQQGMRAWLNGLLGKMPASFEDNARRADFNAIIRQRFGGTGHLFDIAQLESASNGPPHTVTADGRTVEVLDPALTSDGGHLNTAGKELVATAWLHAMMAATQSR